MRVTPALVRLLPLSGEGEGGKRGERGADRGEKVKEGKKDWGREVKRRRSKASRSASWRSM